VDGTGGCAVTEKSNEKWKGSTAGVRLRILLVVGGVILSLATVPVFSGRGGSGAGTVSASVAVAPTTPPGGIPGENGRP
jgi:hypothetical protein